jgi:hypothetical protein
MAEGHKLQGRSGGGTTGLARAAFRALPLGEIEPQGWLARQLRLQADGLTGHLDELWPDVGDDSGWLGGRGEAWERGPYYCDGLVPLAYLLKDARLLTKARRWIEWTLASQRPNGQFGPDANDDWWPRMVMLKALTQYQEASGDARVLPFMARYFRYQARELPARPLRDWGQMRGAENVLSVFWLHARTQDASLLPLVDLLLNQTTDWGSYLASLPARTRVSSFSHLTHVVNVAMGLKLPAVTYLATGAQDHQATVRTGLDNLLRFHGQVQGMFSGDEWLAGLEPTQGVELCAVVEMLFTLEHLARVFGSGAFGDRLELLAYNALAATITPDMRAHQYDQQPNQVLCTVAKRNWTENSDSSNIFGLEPHFGCCTANMHQGWPKLASALWMTDGTGIAALAYAPCAVTTHLAGGDVRIEEETDYPFGESVHLVVRSASGRDFPVALRIPGWCDDARVYVQGRRYDVSSGPGEYTQVRRAWRDGDTLDLELPMRIRGIGRPQGRVGVARGPLIFALQIGEAWTRIPGSPGFGDWEIRPTTPWNYALGADPVRHPELFQVDVRPIAPMPFDLAGAAVRITTIGHRVRGWEVQQNSAGPVPCPPDVDPRPEQIVLVPYGCARLRIAEFPMVAEPPTPI